MRYKRIQLSGIFLTMIFTTGKFPGAVIKNGLPEGCRFAYSFPDNTHGIWIVVEHHSFPIVKDGQIIPVIEPPICEVVNE